MDHVVFVTALLLLLVVALTVALVLLWRVRRQVRQLELILADTDDRARSLEFQLLQTRRLA